MTIIHPRVRATLDHSLHAAVDQVRPLSYAEGAVPELDLPAHVRAASAVRRRDEQLVIVQDDVNAFAVYDQEGSVFALPLPVGPGGRRVFDDLIGNKSQKMDLEACALLPDARLVAFGSGASESRQNLVVASRREPPYVRDAAELYRSLRAQPAFAGSELNIEGAVVLGDRLLLFQRGNGARGAASDPVNAIGALELESFMRWLDRDGPAPTLAAVTPFDLGDIDGAALGFTDAAVMADGRIAILACAEDSPDALTDGPVIGCRFGLLDPNGELRMADILELGSRSRLKLEGIESRPWTPHEFDVVADVDRPLEPALLARLLVRE